MVAGVSGVEGGSGVISGVDAGGGVGVGSCLISGTGTGIGVGVGVGTGDGAGVPLDNVISVCDGVPLETAGVSGALAHDGISGIIIANIISNANNFLIFLYPFFCSFRIRLLYRNNASAPGSNSTY